MEGIVDFIPVSQAIHLSSQNWYRLPEWVIEKYERGGGMVFMWDGLFFRQDEEKFEGKPRDYLVLLENGKLAIWKFPQLLKI